jgi:hypothetical protein
MCVAFGVEGGDAESDNEILNNARHSFKCSMRLVLALASHPTFHIAPSVLTFPFFFCRETRAKDVTF